MLYKVADKSKDNKVTVDTAIGAGLGAGALIGKYNNASRHISGWARQFNPEPPKDAIIWDDIKKQVADTIRIRNKLGYKGDTGIIDVTGIYENSDHLSDLYKKYKFKSIPTYNSDFDKYRPSFNNYKDGSTLAIINLHDKYSTAHEYGHGTGPQLMGKNIKVMNAIDLLGSKGLHTAVAAGALYDKDKSLAEQSAATKIALGATALTGLSNTAILAEEAKASIRGAKALKDLGLSNYKESFKRLGPAYFTYLGPGLVTPIAGYTAASKVSNYLRGNNDSDNTVGSIVGNTALGTTIGSLIGGGYGYLNAENLIKKYNGTHLLKQYIKDNNLNMKDHKDIIKQKEKEILNDIIDKIKYYKTKEPDRYRGHRNHYRNIWGTRGALIGTGLGAGYGVYKYIKNNKNNKGNKGNKGK